MAEKGKSNETGLAATKADDFQGSQSGGTNINTSSATDSVDAGEPFDDAWLLLDNQLCFAAYTLSREIIGLYRSPLERLGLTYTQYITMMVLWEQPETSMKQLGERLFLDSGTLTPLLKKLARMGYVEKQRDFADERSVIIRLTEMGFGLRSQAVGIPAQILCGTGLEAGDAVELRERIRSLVAEIQNHSC